tara:strand:- start:395 stop:517 length:123 start_codon:yes stop_codon:yes gene_type:complete
MQIFKLGGKTVAIILVGLAIVLSVALAVLMPFGIAQHLLN